MHVVEHVRLAGRPHCVLGGLLLVYDYTMHLPSTYSVRGRHKAVFYVGQ